MILKLQNKVFSGMIVCSVVLGYQHSAGPCCLYFISAWRWWQKGHSECWYPTATLDGVTNKKTLTSHQSIYYFNWLKIL